MARSTPPRRKALTTLAAWTVALIIFFPVLWMVLTSFKTEASAVASPPELFSCGSFTGRPAHSARKASNSAAASIRNTRS